MTTDDIMALANKYAASNGKALLEKLYGTSQSYTEQCAAEAFQDRQALSAAIETLRYELDAVPAIKEERDNWQADAIRFREAASCERAVRLELERQVEALEADAERYRWLAKHPNEWRLYRKHGNHKLPYKMMRNGDPWGQSFATADEAIDAARGAK